MQDEMNAAAAADNTQREQPSEDQGNIANQEPQIDQLPSEDDEFRQKVMMQLPRTIPDEDNDGKEKVKWTWHVIEVPESLIPTYQQAEESFNKAMDAVAEEKKSVKIQAVKDNQKLVVKKRGEAKKPGLYLERGNEEEALLIGYVLESGDGKLTEELEKALDDKYFQSNDDGTVANDNAKEQENGLEGGDNPDGIAPS